ncbi:MAG: threonine synthase [Anaerolineae bacterium]|nr:threonine synthase [Anaerolineae bacterium]
MRDYTIWRYRETFGLPPQAQPVSLGEGRTPLVRRQIAGEEVAFKLDFLQPSGSFKDRGASVLMTLVKYLGVDAVVEDSSGNAGAAMAAYAAAADIRCTIYSPDYTPDGKLVQIRLYGAQVARVPGTRQDANDAAIRATERAFYASHLWNPFFCQGLATAAYELWEQMDGAVPSAVIVPAGSGGYLEGLFIGFQALRRAGYARTMPRLIGVQADHCAPLHVAWMRGLNNYAEIAPRPTIAEGIAVQRPPRAAAVLAAIRESGGCTIGVSEEEILDATRTLFRLGLFAEPTSAATLAGWRKLPPAERRGAVLILTGNGLKQTKRLGELFAT